MTRHPEYNRRAYLSWILVCLVWGTTYLAIRIALDGIPPFLMTAFRWLVAGVILIVVLTIRGERWPETRHWPALLTLGLLMIGLGNGMVVWAEQTVPSGLASVLVAVTPFWMTLIERLAGTSERLTWRQLLGLIIGFSGIVLLLWPELQFGGGSGFLAGVVATQVASVGWAVGSSYSRRHEQHPNVLVSAAFQMVFAGACLLPVALMLGEWQRLSLNGRALGALAYLVGVGSLVGYTAYAYALKHLPVTTVSLYAYVNPLIAVALGTIVLSEPLSPRIVAASAVVLAGIAMVRRG